MSSEAWVFFLAWLVTLAALLVVLIGASGARADMDKAFCRFGARFLRAQQTIDALREDNANLEAHIRRQGLFVVGADDPLPVVPASTWDAAEDAEQTETRAAFDSIVRGIDGGEGA